MVPMLTCGLFLTNFSLAICVGLRYLDRSWALFLSDEPVADAAWHFGVVKELHRVRRPALSPRSKVGGVPEHRRQGNLPGDDLYTRPRLDASDLSASCAEIADDVTDDIDRANHLDRHDRLEEDRGRIRRRVAKGLKSRNLEDSVGGIDLVVAAAQEGGDRVDQREAGEHAALGRLLDSRADG